MPLKGLVMALIKLGSLIDIREERNENDFDYPFFGINIDKDFMPSVANTDGVDRSKYKIVRKNRFVFSGMQTGRDVCIRIGLYSGDSPILVSPAYTTFEVISKNVIPAYLFMIFRSKEKDRLGWFLSDSSVRSNLDWDRFCDIQIDLPSVEIQKKYVSVYGSLLSNWLSCQKSFNDLKIACVGYIEDLRRKVPTQKIGPFIEEVNLRNSDGKVGNVCGINTDHEFQETKANLLGVDLTNYKIIQKGTFVFNPSRINIGSIGLYSSNVLSIASPMYEMFRVTSPNLDSNYLFMWLRRDEFKRYSYFNSIGSVRDTFGLSQMAEVQIPIPSIEQQHKIAEIQLSLDEQKIIAKRLKDLLSRVCPILIRGSIEEEHRRQS